MAALSSISRYELELEAVFSRKYYDVEAVPGQKPYLSHEYTDITYSVPVLFSVSNGQNGRLQAKIDASKSVTVKFDA